MTRTSRSRGKSPRGHQRGQRPSSRRPAMTLHDPRPVPDWLSDATAALFPDGVPPSDALFEALSARPMPMTAPGHVIFAWTGEAEGVDLLRWIHAGVDRVPYVRVPDTDLWVLHLPVQDGGRFEYKLAVRRHGHEHWELDPFNPNRAGDPFGENSVCRTWGYERPDWTRRTGAPAGKLEPLAVDSPTFGHARHESVYLPAGYDAQAPYPLVVIHDGLDYDSYADLTVSLDNLIGAGDIPPLVAVLIQTAHRMEEYPRGRRHARYVVDELLPTVTRRYAVSDRPRDRVLMGASLGAVASLATAFRYPGTFGGLILKSGSFIVDEEALRHRPHPVFHRTARLVRAMRRAPALTGTRAFVSTGELEGLADENRALADLLRDRGVDVQFKSAWDGHHWHNWRDQLRDGLMWVLHHDAT
ncbi:esterase family protein [Rhodobacteraceae bacterium CCMM004]|nr:esterase family protein [Rhodobacteraceae bacterium CCMM004]